MLLWHITCCRHSKVPPIRTQHLEGSGPMRVELSTAWRQISADVKVWAVRPRDRRGQVTRISHLQFSLNQSHRTPGWGPPCGDSGLKINISLKYYPEIASQIWEVIEEVPPTPAHFQAVEHLRFEDTSHLPSPTTHQPLSLALTSFTGLVVCSALYRLAYNGFLLRAGGHSYQLMNDKSLILWVLTLYILILPSILGSDYAK